MMNPAFAYSNIKEMVPIFIHVSSILKGLIENEINQGNSNINLTPYISKAALDIIGLVGFKYVPFIGDIPIVENGVLKNKDLLSLLINTNKTLPDEETMTYEELKNLLMTFLIAGHDTTNVATCWALYLLVQHPHEQDLLREELVKA
ncbi:cytochrome P450 [Rhizophagus irregularis DAOM 181602=DAOM 197198]|nr:cytochrome P450 [Rhizophagus irregularis DAOM 181602=DAOM 197198]